MTLEYTINNKHRGNIFLFGIKTDADAMNTLADIMIVLKKQFKKETGERIQSLTIFEKQGI